MHTHSRALGALVELMIRLKNCLSQPFWTEIHASQNVPPVVPEALDLKLLPGKNGGWAITGEPFKAVGIVQPTPPGPMS